MANDLHDRDEKDLPFATSSFDWFGLMGSSILPQSADGPHAAREPGGREAHPLGRYRISHVLGKGGFGTVYLAHDAELNRAVAIKVPRRNRIFLQDNLELYLREARLVAGLDHPSIVPVYDVGRTEDGVPYVVSKFIDGSSLAERMLRGPVSHEMAMTWIATVSEALHYVHARGLIHRDIKPGNILIDTSDRPFVTDFGLALHESDFGKEGPMAGTPWYLSPEQARGEGHLVDGRADIFSLGVVLYELITNTTPFRGEDTMEVIHRILLLEAKPPRQIDDSIPIELERICLKAISKRVVDRYSTAIDFAHDLRRLFEDGREDRSIGKEPGGVLASRPGAIVPRGLRSFEAEDTGFFLDLLPGPRDGEGLPRTVRFWKSRLEATDAEETFRVGLMYGPSGSGKSSLLKAGVLPRLEGTVLPVVLESTPADMEARLLKKVRDRLPGLPVEHDLTDALSAVRRGAFLAPGRKLLIVLDQFEQWLHAWMPGGEGSLVRALRQCDGSRAQCLLLVRDDFWLAATRFLWDLDAPLVEGGNALAVDLFDRRHARAVLETFGRAYGAFPAAPGQVDRDREAFLDEAIAGLSRDGRVSPVRLALFTEMFKARTWSLASLRQAGGAEGVGTRFLEETFQGGTASPDHRMHRPAAQAVLQALLPERESNLRGRARSRDQLQEASGYGRRPREFDDLLRVLVSEIRLLSPVDPVADSEVGNAGQPAEAAGTPRYQLTHDYLVPSVREWLTREQRRTRRGRLESQLADRASLWRERPGRKQLPSLWEWLNIVLFTRRRRWTEVERRMISSAGLKHALSSAAAVILASVLAVGGLWVWKGMKAQGLVDILFSAEMEEVPRIVADMEPLRSRVDPILAEEASKPTLEEGRKVRLGLARLPRDAGEVPLLERRMLEAAPAEFEVLRQALLPHAGTLSPRMWKILEDGVAPGDRRLRAAGALAAFDPRDARWSARAEEFVPILLSENPLHVVRWIELLRPVRASLVPSLKKAFESADSRTRQSAALVLSEYVEASRDVASLSLEGDPAQLDILSARLTRDAAYVTDFLRSEASGTGAGDDTAARRRANAVLALLKMGRMDDAWPWFGEPARPALGPYLIHRIAAARVDPAAILERIRRETVPFARRNLILALGGYGSDLLPAGARSPIVNELAAMYAADPHPGVHGALDWLLRRWGAGAAVEEADDALRGGPSPGRPWFPVAGGHTMIVVRGPVEFIPGQASREKQESGAKPPASIKIPYSFAVATKETSVIQYLAFRKEQKYSKELCPEEGCPIHVTIFEAMAYCRWLSEREGVPEDQMCYPPVGEILQGEVPYRGYLERTGYRLTTSAEWEAACRSGGLEAASCDCPGELLGEYAWYRENARNRTWPAGTARPNELGFFDLVGNFQEWCHRADESDVRKGEGYFAVRGPWLESLPWFMKCQHAGGNVTPQTPYIGFRVARTIQ